MEENMGIPKLYIHYIDIKTNKVLLKIGAHACPRITDEIRISGNMYQVVKVVWCPTEDCVSKGGRINIGLADLGEKG